ncbi:MAG: carotenoid 1,2-hydratase [Rubrivivax sp.]|nr:carotenoid 1,2-hydratase [Rubrivivax sp.]
MASSAVPGAASGAASGAVSDASSGAAPGRPAAAAEAVRPETTTPADDPVRRGRALAFPRDHGAHPGARTEWWYATGWAGSESAPAFGWQLTFFRSRSFLAEGLASRFAARQVLFAHAAVSDLAAGRHQHDQRIARWNGDPQAAGDRAALHDADLRLARWTLRRDGDRWRSALPAAGFTLEVDLARTQPLLLQGDAGFSRKGPEERQASHYYSEPQLAAEVAVTRDGRTQRLAGRGWLDHEWSDEILHRDAVGWDWCGINLFDGSALTAFVLRRRDGSALWAGGSFRAAGAASRSFAPDEVRFVPGRRWRSPATDADYPVQWTLDTAAGRYTVNALLDAQEMASQGGSGTIYWEGLSELLDAGGRRIGLGYLEMTGYAGRLRL